MANRRVEASITCNDCQTQYTVTDDQDSMLRIAYSCPSCDSKNRVSRETPRKVISEAPKIEENRNGEDRQETPKRSDPETTDKALMNDRAQKLIQFVKVYLPKLAFREAMTQWAALNSEEAVETRGLLLELADMLVTPETTDSAIATAAPLQRLGIKSKVDEPLPSEPPWVARRFAPIASLQNNSTHVEQLPSEPPWVARRFEGLPQGLLDVSGRSGSTPTPLLGSAEAHREDSGTRISGPVVEDSDDSSRLSEPLKAKRPNDPIEMEKDDRHPVVTKGWKKLLFPIKRRFAKNPSSDISKPLPGDESITDGVFLKQWTALLDQKLAPLLARKDAGADRQAKLEKLIEDLPELFDSFEEPLAKWQAERKLDDQQKPFREAVLVVLRTIKQDLDRWKRRNKIATFPRPTDPYDPDLHKPINIKPAPEDQMRGTINYVILTGYQRDGDLLRRAEVAVWGDPEPSRAGTEPPKGPAAFDSESETVSTGADHAASSAMPMIPSESTTPTSDLNSDSDSGTEASPPIGAEDSARGLNSTNISGLEANTFNETHVAIPCDNADDQETSGKSTQDDE